mgnify:CR=1 FL=1
MNFEKFGQKYLKNKFLEKNISNILIYEKFKLKHLEMKDKFDVIFVVKSLSSKYIAPAKFEDDLIVVSKIIEKNIAKSNSKITNDFIEQKSVILGKTNLVEFAFGTCLLYTSPSPRDS